MLGKEQLGMNPSGSSTAEIVSAVASVLEVFFIGVAGLAALYVYRRTRRGQVRVGISAASRIIREWNPGRSVLLVRLRLSNTSNVLYRHREATATLMDARREIVGTRQIRLAPFTQADPLPPVYGDMDTSSGAVQGGELFRLDPAAVTLEPGEYVESELAFPLDSDKLGLMALRVLLRGRQRRFLFPRDYWWGSFFYIAPEAEEVTLEPANEQEQS
jgi:hypothetical protein